MHINLISYKLQDNFLQFSSLLFKEITQENEFVILRTLIINNKGKYIVKLFKQGLSCEYYNSNKKSF